MRTLAQWLELQQSAHSASIDLGLQRVAAVARAMGRHVAPWPVITVGGTNGKGSVVAHLEAFLRASGASTGVFTSPHLVRYNERVRIDGAEAADAELVAAFERIEEARGEITLTYFEYSTLAALSIFAERAVDVVVLEVGLGGRLDATNLLDADVAVLCSVGLDHRDWLGDTLESIGEEKAGIFRHGRPAVLGSAEMPASVLARLDALGVEPLVAERDFRWIAHAQCWDYEGPRLRLEQLPRSALAGDIQLRNAATALAALEALGKFQPDPRAAAEGLRNVHLPGRFQIVPGEVEWILDVAHNEPAARVLASHLDARPNPARTLAVCSVLADKDAAAIFAVLAPHVDEWIICSVAGPRGVPAAELARHLPAGARAPVLAQSVEGGCELASRMARPGDRVVVFGSFLVVGAALSWLRLY